MTRSVRMGSSAVLAFVALTTGAAAAGLTGPLYPMPGAAGSGHGGDVCVSAGGFDQDVGFTWAFGGGKPTNDKTCPPGTTVPAPFDTSRFAKLYGGADGRADAVSKRPQIAMDGAADAPTETLSF